jgi:hypothetical protein
MATGRALATALLNIASRTFILNGEARTVRILPKEKIVPAIQAVVDMRRLNEPVHLTTTRALAGIVASGASMQDERIDALVELASDLGIVALSVDRATNTITFEAEFSEANAVAAAYLQGGGVQGVQGARQRVRYLNQQLKGADGGVAVPSGSAQTSSGMAGAKPTPKGVIRARRRR